MTPTSTFTGRSPLAIRRWRRVDFDRGLMLLEARHAKTARRRSVPLNDGALDALHELRLWCHERYPGTVWVFPSSSGDHVRWLKAGLRGDCISANICDFRINDLRHTFASWLVMAGVDLFVVREILGHSSITKTEKYSTSLRV